MPSKKFNYVVNNKFLSLNILLRKLKLQTCILAQIERHV